MSVRSRFGSFLHNPQSHDENESTETALGPWRECSVKRKKHVVRPLFHQGRKQVKRSPQDPVSESTGQPVEPVFRSDSRLVSLRHHPSLWLAPATLLILALLPWPYGFYNLLRLAVCVVSAWLAYEQWKHDDAVSGWVVALSAAALLYNPLLPIHLTREIWSVLNIATAGLFLGHLRVLKNLVNTQAPYLRPPEERTSTSSSDSKGRGTSRSVEPRSRGPGSA